MGERKGKENGNDRENGKGMGEKNERKRNRPKKHKKTGEAKSKERGSKTKERALHYCIILFANMTLPMKNNVFFFVCFLVTLI